MANALGRDMTSTLEQRRVLLVCSPGGHFAQMLALESAWSEHVVTWATLRAADTESYLSGATSTYCFGPTNRSLINLVRNTIVALRLIQRQRPHTILSTGAALAVPFFVVGKLFGCRLVYVESVTRVNGPSLSGRLVYHLSDAFFVQWPQAAKRRRMRCAGALL